MKFAFFDFDETLISFKSMFEYKYFLTAIDEGSAKKADLTHDIFMEKINRLSLDNPRQEVNKWFYSTFKGQSIERLESVTNIWYKWLKTSNKDIYINKTTTLLKELQSNGYTPVIVSGSTEIILKPFAKELNILETLTSKPEIKDGVLTGELIGSPVIGNGKKIAIEKFCRNNNVHPSQCYAIGDHISDLEMLNYTGKSAVVNACDNLLKHATEKKWRVL